MEDYKKKYEAAIKQAKKELKTCGSLDCDAARQIFRLFPELKESKDERIRKNLREFLLDAPSQDIVDHHLDLDETLNWLEKQGEQLCWIKCSDGLPNRDGTYLVVTDGRHNDVYDMAKYDSIEGWHKSSEVIYWMPIPQLNNKSIIEQKPAWSEEDEKIYNLLYEEYKNIAYYSHSREKAEDIPGEVLGWLKSLKERMK